MFNIYFKILACMEDNRFNSCRQRQANIAIQLAIHITDFFLSLNICYIIRNMAPKKKRLFTVNNIVNIVVYSLSLTVMQTKAVTV